MADSTPKDVDIRATCSATPCIVGPDNDITLVKRVQCLSCFALNQLYIIEFAFLGKISIRAAKPGHYQQSKGKVYTFNGDNSVQDGFASSLKKCLL